MDARRLIINQADQEGHCVWYVMARDQRLRANPALNRAVELARLHNVPLAIVFCLTKKTPGATREQYDFMLQGLREMEQDLPANVPLMIMMGKRRDWLTTLGHHTQPAAVVFDFHPSAKIMAMQKEIAHNLGVYAEVVDAHNILPFAAADVAWPEAISDFTGADMTSIPAWPGRIMRRDEIDGMIENYLESIPSSNLLYECAPGETAAHAKLEALLEPSIHKAEANLQENIMDSLDPYLHFGQISQAQIVQRLQKAAHEQPQLQSYYTGVIEEIMSKSM